MKIIDKTALQDEKGNISFPARIQGTLKYGLSWYSELEAQKIVITQLDRALEKGFVLIRNFTMPNSEIVIPIILIGPPGISVIYVTQVKGFFEAKGDQWNTVNNGRTQPATINLLDRVAKLARVFQKYLEFQKVSLPSPVEPVLIATDPGAQIESMRPIARVVRSDAIKQFASSLAQGRPIWRSDFIYDLADRIVDPRPPEELKPAAAEPDPASRAKAIFNASDPTKSPTADDLGFAFEEEVEPQTVPKNLREPNPARPLPRPKPAADQDKILGMSRQQVIVLAALLIVECCIVIGFGALFLSNQ